MESVDRIQCSTPKNILWTTTSVWSYFLSTSGSKYVYSGLGDQGVVEAKNAFIAQLLDLVACDG